MQSETLTTVQEPARLPGEAASRRLRWTAGTALTVLVAAIVIGLVLDVLHPVVLLVAVMLVGAGSAGLGSRILGASLRPMLILAIAWLVMIIFIAVFVGVLPFGESMNPGKTLYEPALSLPDFSAEHPLGTDRHGLDLLGGLAYGARVSLTVGIGATLVGGFLGGLIGMAAGFLRGRFDVVVSLLTDSMLAFPPLILLIAVVAVLKPSTFVVMCALGVLTVPFYVRLARAYTISLAPREFVLAARAMGARRWRIIVFELLPNVFWPLASYSVIVVASMIVAEASLSYLGLSVQRPIPTWGNMIAAGQDSFQSLPYLVLVPGVVMFFTVLSINAVGEHVQNRFSNSDRNA